VEENEERSCDSSYHHGSITGKTRRAGSLAAKKKNTAKQVSHVIIQIALTVIILTGIAMLFYTGIRKGYEVGYSLIGSSAVAEAPGTDRLFVVEEGMSKSECMSDLKKAGLIRDSYVALFQEWFYELEIYPGTYTLNTSMTVREILETLNQEPETTTSTETSKTTEGDE
jgi:cell division protein YceG involved in septum cleavage